MKSFLVIGLGRFGTSTALTLTGMGHEVLAVDISEERVNAVRDRVLRAVIADCTDERALSELGVRNFDCVVVSVGNDLRASILSTVLCRELGAKTIVAKAQDELHAKLLLKTGADRVVQPEYDGGLRLARQLASESIIDSLDISDEYSINEIRVPAAWVGKTLAGLHVRAAYGVSVIAVRRKSHVRVNLDPNTPFMTDDTLFIIGDNKSLDRIPS